MNFPTLTLNNGVTMPSIGLGVFQAPPEHTTKAVSDALAIGYRHIDTAAGYGNEREVGVAIAESGIARDDIFIETKVWISDYGYAETLHAFDKSAAKLSVEYLDLFILHQPLPTAFHLTLEAYRALEALYREGKVRAIGVSNFSVRELTSLLEVATIVPAVNQLEMHPYFQQRDVIAFGETNGIASQAWSPIGGITFYPGFGDDRRSTLDDAVLLDIAAHHHKSAAQVMLRWHIQQGRSVIPKSVNPARMAENLEIFDFQLSPAEMSCIDELETGRRGGIEPADITLGFGGGFTIPEA